MASRSDFSTPRVSSLLLLLFFLALGCGDHSGYLDHLFDDLEFDLSISSGEGVVVSPGNGIWGVLCTTEARIPTTHDAFLARGQGASDVLLFALDETAGQQRFASYLGGSDQDSVAFAALDSDGNIVLGGTTRSADFPVTPGAYDETRDGPSDSWIAKVDPETIAAFYRAAEAFLKQHVLFA